MFKNLANKPKYPQSFIHWNTGKRQAYQDVIADADFYQKKSHIWQSTANKFAGSFHFSPATVTAEGRVISNKWGQGFGGRSRFGEGDDDDEEDEVVFLQSGISNKWGHGLFG